MRVRSLQRHQGDYSLNAVQDNVEEHTRVITESPIINGRLIKDISVAASKEMKEVEHKLGREPKGWIVVRRIAVSSTSTAMPLYENSLAEDKDKILTVYTPGDAIKVDLWVF